MPVTSAASAIKAGTVAHFAASTAPAGWIKANGAAVSRSLYAALFNAIGTTYGVGDGSTTFNVPDLRGEFLRGLDDGRGVDTGRSIGTAQAHDVQSHAHNANAYSHAPTTGVGTNFGGRDFNVGSTATWSNSTGSSVGGTETRPRNVAVLACIKY